MEWPTSSCGNCKDDPKKVLETEGANTKGCVCEVAQEKIKRSLLLEEVEVNFLRRVQEQIKEGEKGSTGPEKRWVRGLFLRLWGRVLVK